MKQIHHILSAISAALLTLLMTLLGTQLAFGYSLENIEVVEQNLPSGIERSSYRIPLKATTHTASLVASLSVDETTNDAYARIVLDPHGQSTNLVSLRISFSTTTLRYQGTMYDESAFSFGFLEEYDPDKGLIILHVMQPYPGVETLSEVVTLHFRSTDPGIATVTFEEGTQVLANDGFGTDILSETQGALALIQG